MEAGNTDCLRVLCICINTTTSSRSAQILPYARRGSNNSGNSVWLPVSPLCFLLNHAILWLVSHPLLLLPQLVRIKHPLGSQTPTLLPAKSKPTTLKKKGSGKQDMEGEKQWLMQFLATSCTPTLTGSRSSEDAFALLLWFVVNS